MVMQLHLRTVWESDHKIIESFPLNPEPGLKIMQVFGKMKLKRLHTKCILRGPNWLSVANSNTGSHVQVKVR